MLLQDGTVTSRDAKSVKSTKVAKFLDPRELALTSLIEGRYMVLGVLSIYRN